MQRISQAFLIGLKTVADAKCLDLFSCIFFCNEGKIKSIKWYNQFQHSKTKTYNVTSPSSFQRT